MAVAKHSGINEGQLWTIRAASQVWFRKTQRAGQWFRTEIATIGQMMFDTAGHGGNERLQASGWAHSNVCHTGR
jgi:hypothetical protein|eukprot:COSAG06_NODE_14943_length_1113_cov_1.173570_1_plen_74_part_00